MDVPSGKRKGLEGRYWVSRPWINCLDEVFRSGELLHVSGEARGPSSGKKKHNWMELTNGAKQPPKTARRCAWEETLSGGRDGHRSKKKSNAPVNPFRGGNGRKNNRPFQRGPTKDI